MSGRSSHWFLEESHVVQGVSGIGAGFLTQLFPAVTRSMDLGNGSQATIIPFRQPVVPASQVLVASGHDPIEHVLDKKFNVSHTPVDRMRISDAALAGARYLFIGCGPRLSEHAPGRIAEWVAAGGCLMTSDWMSFNLLEKAFQNDDGEPLIRRRPVSAKSESWVKIVGQGPSASYDPTVGLLRNTKSPGFWKVSSCSYPIGAIDKTRVSVLARSPDLAALFDGEAAASDAETDALFLRFTHGIGQVLHIVSHWYEQHFDVQPPSGDRPPSSRTMVFTRIPGITK
jgi:hypothetical protein